MNLSIKFAVSAISKLSIVHSTVNVFFARSQCCYFKTIIQFNVPQHFTQANAHDNDPLKPLSQQLPVCSRKLFVHKMIQPLKMNDFFGVLCLQKTFNSNIQVIYMISILNDYNRTHMREEKKHFIFILTLKERRFFNASAFRNNSFASIFLRDENCH